MGDIYENKKLMLEHILYEMIMYLVTANMLEKPDQIKFNIIWECHLLHLRNLIEFFTEAKRSILYNHVLDEADFLKLNYADLEQAKKIADKTVHHLTQERFKELKYTINARAEADNAKTLIVPAIRNFLLVLPDKIKDGYRKELSVQKIIDDIKTVENLLKTKPKTKSQPTFNTTASTSVSQVSIL